MHFVTPLYLIGLGAAAVPVLIHLIGRSRARLRPFAAVDFIVRSDRRVARRLRLRQLVLLAVRALAAAAIAMILAKPYVEARTELPASIGRPQSVVLVLDNSASMGYRLRGEQLFDLARREAREILGLLGRGADAALVLASEGEEIAGPGAPQPPRAGAPVPELTMDRLRLRRAIDEAPLSARATDVGGALRRAAQILAHSAHAERRVILLTDLTAAVDFGEAPFGPGADAPELVVIDVSRGAPLPNHAVTEVRVEPAPELGPRGLRVIAAVTSCGDRPQPQVPIELRVDDRVVARGFVDLPATGTVQKVFHHSFPPGDLFSLAVALDGDDLPADDRRFVRVEVRREVRVLLVDGDPRTVRHEDELFYLETALRPGDRSDSQLAVAVTTTDELGKRRLADYDVVFLCNVKALAAPQVAGLEEFVRRGGGLFVALGDNVDADAYAARMAPLLPQALRDVRVAALEATARAEGDRPWRVKGERLGAVDVRHPILAAFSRQAEGLRSARFGRYYLLSPDADARPFGGGTGEPHRQTILRYESGAPALIEGALGAGRVLLYTSTVDRDWNDLPIRPGFLPLMQQAARYLARVSLREPEPGGVVGRPYRVPVSAGDSRVEVRLPGGHTHVFRQADLAGHEALMFRDTETPGFYRVSAAAAGQALRARPQADFAINLDPRESDLRHVAAKPRAARAARGEPASGGASLRRVELWHGVAAALLALLVLEAVLVRRG